MDILAVSEPELSILDNFFLYRSESVDSLQSTVVLEF